MTTYTIYNIHTGEIIERGATLDRAAAERLTYDGDRFEIIVRSDETEIVGFDRSGRQIPLYDGPGASGRMLLEWKGTPHERLERLYERVLTADWDNVPVVAQSDEDYHRDVVEALDDDQIAAIRDHHNWSRCERADGQIIWNLSSEGGAGWHVATLDQILEGIR